MKQIRRYSPMPIFHNPREYVSVSDPSPQKIRDVRIVVGIACLLVLFWGWVGVALAQATVPTSLMISWTNPTTGTNAKGETVALSGAAALTSVRVFVAQATIPATADLRTAVAVSRPADSGGLKSRAVYTASLPQNTILFIRVAACNDSAGTGTAQCTFSTESTYTTKADVRVTPGKPENVSVTFTATVSNSL